MVNLLAIWVLINVMGWLTGLIGILVEFLDPNDFTTKKELPVHILLWLYLSVNIYFLWNYLMVFPST